jgi:hypothetical protein
MKRITCMLEACWKGGLMGLKTWFLNSGEEKYLYVWQDFKPTASSPVQVNRKEMIKNIK